MKRKAVSPSTGPTKDAVLFRGLKSSLPVLAMLFAGSAFATDSDSDGISDTDEGAVTGSPLNLIFNRGFESPVISNAWQLVGASDVSNWSTTSNCDCIEIWRDGHNGVPAVQGQQFIELNSVAASDLYQVMTVPAGHATIKYSFSHRGRSTTNTVEVYGGTDAGSKVLLDTVSTDETAWQVYSGQWDKPAGATTIYLEFKAVDDGSVANFLDDIVVNAVSVDTDNDGTPDYMDSDSDNDGIPDNIELTADNDSDGIADFRDPDAMGAGALDNDGDGLSNYTEFSTTETDPDNPDTDGDGLEDGEEVNTYNTDPNNADTDGGGTSDGAEVANGSNPRDDAADDSVDSDGDGLSDIAEANIGTDPANPDTDGDGLTDGVEVNTAGSDPNSPDTDADGLTDAQEVNDTGTDPMLSDTDDDGLSDGVEVETVSSDPLIADTDGDLLTDGDEFNTHNTDATEPDTDGDGLSDGDEVNDTNTDPQLADTDNDGLSDGDEVNIHSTDPNNPDSDAGGADDGNEVLAGTDPTVSGDDVIDLDTDDDGIPDLVEGGGDQDADGVPNFRDLDSDNDGIADVIEAGGIDTNGDGMVDDFVDENDDGLHDPLAADPLPAADTDNDGLPDYLDVDSDQDGLSDTLEAGGPDADNDGAIDGFTDDDGNGFDDAATAGPLPVPNTDGDAKPDYLDLDSDGDGVKDLVESGGTDADGNGMIDLFLDDDGDGIPNVADVTSTAGIDTDGDGIDDIADIDLTSGSDINNNGIDDQFEADPDGDGRASIVASDGMTLPDADGDGTPDYLDRNGPRIITGLSGSAAGCAIMAGGTDKVDPLLPVMLLMLTALIGRRSWRRR